MNIMQQALVNAGVVDARRAKRIADKAEWEEREARRKADAAKNAERKALRDRASKPSGG